MEPRNRREEPSAKFLESRDRLPEDLRPIYEQLVEEYRFRTTVHYRQGYVAYQVLADLVLMGWRPAGEDRLPREPGGT